MKALGAAGQLPEAAALKAAQKAGEKHRERKERKEAVGVKVEKATVRSKADALILASPRVRMLTAEYAVALVLAIIALFYTDATYEKKMRTFVVQLSGISAVYFILAMSGVSEKAARVAIAFGALIDLAILFRVFRIGKSASPKAAEMVTESAPFWTTNPNGVAQGNTGSATPGPLVTGPGLATPKPPPALGRVLVAI